MAGGFAAPAAPVPSVGPAIQGTPDDMREMIRRLYLVCVESSNELARHKVLRRVDETKVEGIEEHFMRKDGFFMKWSNFYDITRMTFDDTELEVDVPEAGLEAAKDKLLEELDDWRLRIGPHVDDNAIAEGIALFKKYGSPTMRTERGRLIDEIDNWRLRIEDNRIDADAVNEGLRLFRKYASVLKTKSILKVV